MVRGRRSNSAKSNGATLGFGATLWAAAYKLRNNMDAAEYKHVVLGLIFLKYISDACELYNRLILVVGSAGNGKTEALQRVQTA